MLVNNNNSSGGSNVTLSGVISGTGNIASNDTGSSASELILSGSVNNSGTITNIGTETGTTLLISGTVGSAVTGIYSTSNGATSVSGSMQMNPGGTTLQVGGTGGMTVSAPIGGSGNLTLNCSNTGALTLSGTAVNFSGTLTNSSGSSGLVTISGNLGPNVGLVNQNAGYSTMVLSGTNTNAGGVQLSNGTLRLSSTSAIGAAASTLALNSGTLDSGVANLVIANNNPVTIGGPFTFQGTQNLNLGTGAVTLNAPATITVNANTLTCGGNFGTSTYAITKAGLGSLTLNGSNGYTGLTVTAGTVNLGVVGAQGAGGMTLGTTGASTGATLNVAGIGAAAGGSYAGAISAVGSGANTLSVTAWNPTFTGPVTLGISGSSNLTLLTNNAGGSPLGITGGISGTGNLTITSAAANAKNSLITLGGSSINNTGTITNNGGATLSSSAAFGGIGTLISAPIGGNVTGLTQNSATVPLFLSGANTYFGNTTVAAGILDYMNTGALSLSSTTTVASAGVLGLGVGGSLGFASSDVDALFAGTPAGSVANVSTNATAGIGIDTTAGNFIYATSNSGANSLVKLGPNTLTLSGTNSYTGTTTVDTGTLAITGSFGSGMNTVNVNYGAILQLQSNSGNTSAGTANVLNFPGGGATAGSGKFNLNNGSALQLRSDNSVTFNGTNGIGNLNNMATTIDVDAVTPGTTNQVLALMPNGSPIGNAVTINVTGNVAGSGYSLATGVFESVTGTTTLTLVPTTASVAVSGFTSNQNTASSVVLDGTATGNSIGAISNGTGTGTTSVTKQNSSTWTLTASNTYTGATSITNGVLDLSGTLAGGSAITVNGANAVFNELPSGVISGATTTFTLTNGSGTLGGVNSYTGATSLAAGSLAVTGTLGYTPVTVSGGTLTVAAAGNLGMGNLNLSSSTAVVNLNSPQAIGTLTGAASAALNLVGVGTTLTLSETANTAYAGTITGSGGLTLGGASNGYTLTLSGSNSFTGGLTIQAGSVTGSGNANAFGANGNVITLGASSGAANTQINGSAFNFPNPITVAGGNTGTATLSTNSAAPTYSGPITLNNHNLTFGNNGYTITATGGISGTGSVTLSAAGGNAITLSGGSVNPIGTITNNGAGGAANVISGGVGANVTGITQASNSGSLTISTNPITVNSLGTTLTASGSALLTVSGGVSGSGNLVLDNNSTNAAGITLSTTSVSNSGTITNAGSGPGGVTISVPIGSGVSNVVQNSANSWMTLSGANSNAALTINAGGVIITADNQLGASSGTIAISGGTLQENTGFNMGAGRLITIGTNGATFNENATANFNIQGVIQDAGPGAGALSITGTNTGYYVPAAQNTYSGGTHLGPTTTAVINSSSVGSASNANLVSGPFGTGILYMDGGKQRSSTGAGTWIIGNAVQITADSTFIAGSSNPLIFTGPVTLMNGTRTITTNSPGNIIFSGAIGDNSLGYGLTLGSSSTTQLDLAGANTYTGPTTVNAGVLSLDAGGSLNSASSVVVNGGAASSVFQLNGGALNGSQITVNAGGAVGGTFLVKGNNTIGASGSPTLTVNGGSTPAVAGSLSLVDGTFNTLTLNTATPANPVLVLGGGIAGSPANLSFEIGNASAGDQIVLGPGAQAAVNLGGALVTLNALGGYDGSAHVLISSPTTNLTTTAGAIVLNTSAGNWGGNSLALVTTPSAVTVSGTPNPAQATLYFKGAQDANWNTFTGGSANNSNWTTDAAGTTDAHVDPNSVTNVYFYTTGAGTANLATTLGQSFTINSLTLNGSGTNAVSIAPGGGTLTINAGSGAGITANAGAGALTVTAPVVLGANQTWTNNSASAVTISGGVSGAANLAVSNGTTGGTTITTLSSAGNVTVSDAGAGGTTISMLNNVGSYTRTATNSTTFDYINGIGANVTAITQNNPNMTSSLIIVGTNTAYTGTTTLNAGRLDDQNAGTSPAIYALGTGPIVLNGGQFEPRAIGTASYQTYISGNGTVGSNVTVGGTTTIDVEQKSGANTNNTYVFNNLAIGNNQLNVTGTVGDALMFAGTTTISGSAAFNATTAALYLAGPVATTGSPTISVSGAGGLRLFNTASAAPDNLAGTTIAVNNTFLQGFATPAAAAVAGSNSLGTSTVMLSGTAALLLAPNVTGGLTVATSAGLAAKGYQNGGNLTSLAATNFLGANQAIANATGGFSFLNMPATGGTVAQLNSPNNSSAGFPATTSYQFTGLLNISTAGIYNFSQSIDDYSNLYIDGNSPLSVLAWGTSAGAVYLSAGLHTFTERVNNNGGNGMVIVDYQGPDTGGALIATPSTSFSYVPTNAAAALTTSFGNNVVVAAGSNPTIQVAANTTLGSLTVSGTAATTLNAAGAGDINTLTFNGVTTLGGSLTITNATANVVLAGGVAISGGAGPALIKSNAFGSLTIAGSTPSTVPIVYNGGLLAFANDGTGNNGTIAGFQGYNILIGASGLTISVGNYSTSNSGNTIALGGLTAPGTTSTTTTFSGSNGYNVSFTSLAMNNGTGDGTTLVPNSTSVSIGNVTNPMSGYGTGNYDTLYLDGTTTANQITGNISDAAGGSYLPLLGGYTRIIKQNTSTWTLSGTGSTYTGITQVINGTLMSGANNVIPLTNLQGIQVAAGVGDTAIYDFNGFNQTLNTSGGVGVALTLSGGSGGASKPEILGTGSTVVINGGVTYTSTNNPLGGLISISNLDLGGGTQTFSVGLSTNAGTLANPDLTVSSNITDGALTKTGAGVLLLSGSNNYTGGTTLSAGVLGITSSNALVPGSTVYMSAGSTFDLGGASEYLLLNGGGTVQNGTVQANGSGVFLHQGPGTLTLNALVASSSSAVLNQALVGTVANPATVSMLNLNYASGVTTTYFPASNTLTLGGPVGSLVAGGGLALAGSAGAANSQAFASTLVDGGASALSLAAGSSGSVALNLGTLTRNPGGTVDIGLPTSGTSQSATNGVAVTNPGSAGTLVVSASGTAFATVGGNDWAAYSTLSPGNIVTASSAGASGASLYTSASSAATFSGNANITGSFTANSGATVNSLRFSGTNTLTLAGVNTISTGGVLFASTAGSATTIAGGTIEPGAGQELTFITNAADVQPIITSVIANGASGPTTVTFRGNPNGNTTAGGILGFGANNTYTGPTYVTSGRLQVSTSGITTPLGTGSNAIVYVDGNADGQFFMSANDTIANPFVIVGAGFNEGGTRRGVIRLDSGAGITPTLTGAITMLGDSTIGNNSSGTAGVAVVSGNIGTSSALGSTSFALTKVLTGEIKLSGSNNQTATNINAGILNVNADAALGIASAPITFTGNSTLQFQNSMTLPATQNITLNSGVTATFDTTPLSSAQSVTINGVISGAGALTKTDNGTNQSPLVLTASNTFTGGVTITEGLVTITNSLGLGTGTKTITITNGSAGQPGLVLDPSQGSTPSASIVLPATISFLTSSSTGVGSIVNNWGNNTINGNFTLESGGGATLLTSNSGSITFTGTFTPNTTSRQLNLAGNGSGAITGVIANGGGTYLPVVQTSGTGTWLLSAANSYSGNTQVEAGTLQLGNSGAIGAYLAAIVPGTTTKNTQVSSGATLDLNATNISNQQITIAGAGNGGSGALINSNTSGLAVVAGSSLASVGLASAANGAYSSTVTVSGGGGSGAAVTANLGVTTASFTVSSGTDTYSGAPTVTIAGGSGATATALLGLTAASFTISSGTDTYSVAPNVTISGGGGTGATATAVLTGGTVTGITITNPGSGYTTAPTLAFSGGTISNGGTLAPSATGNATYFEVTGVNVTAAGANFTTTPTLSFSGGTVTNAGTLSPSATGNASNFVFNSISITSGGMGYTSAPTLSDGAAVFTTPAVAGVLLTNSASLGGPGNLEIDSPISGGYGITKVGAGNLYLTAADVYSGGTTVSNGTLQLGNAAALGTGGLTTTGGVLDLHGFSLTVGGSNALPSLSGTGGTITDNSAAGSTTLTVQQSGGTTYAGALLDGANTSIALVKAGTGTLNLAGSNGYSGGTTVSGGILQLGNSAALGNAAVPAIGAYPLSVVTGGTLDLHGYSPTVGALTGNASGLITNLAGSTTSTLTTNTATATTFAGTIWNNGSMINLVKTGTGSLALTGTSTYSGTTSINQGTLQFTSMAALGNPSAGNGTINLGGGATLQFIGAHANTTRAINLTGSAAIDASGPNQSDVFQLSGTANSVTYTGGSGDNLTLQGSSAVGGVVHTAMNLGNGSLTKAGSGTWELDAANTYSGGTIINAGTLVLGNPNGGLALGSGPVNITGGTLDASLLAATVGSTFTVGSAGALNLIVGSPLTINGSASLGGTLNLFGVTASTGTKDLMNYSSEVGTFTSFTGVLSPTYTLAYTSNQLDLVYSTTATTYALAASAGSLNMHVGASNTITATIANTGGNLADTLNYTGLTLSPSTLLTTGFAPLSGGPLALGSGTSNSGTFTPATAGSYSFTPSVASVANATIGNGSGAPALSNSTSVTVGVWNYAAPSTLSSTVTLPNVHVNGSFGTQTLTIQNAGPGSFTEGLDAAATASGAASATGSVSNLSGGSSSAAISVGLAGANTNAAGPITGNVTLSYSSDGLNSGLTTTPLTNSSQTITVQSGVYNYAAPVVQGGLSVSFSTYHVGNPTPTQTLSVLNNAPANYSEKLNASIGSPTAGVITNSGSFSRLLPASQTNSTDLQVGLDTSTAGQKNGSATITLISDGTGTSGLAPTTLTPVTLTVTGNVFSGNGYWTGTGGTTSWGNQAATSNWVDEHGIAGAPGTWAPNYSDSATFDDRAANMTITLDGASPTLSVLTFNTSAGGSYNLEQGSSGTLNLNNGPNAAATVNVLSGTHAISAPISLASSATFNMTTNPFSTIGSPVLTVTGNITDGGNGLPLILTGDNTGTLILSGTDNTYSGGTYVDDGTLIVNNTGALLDGSSLVVGAGGTFFYDPTAGGAANAPALTEKASDRSLAPVPEPGTLALLSVAGIVAAAAVWRRRRNRGN